jgi:hypothetical protein
VNKMAHAGAAAGILAAGFGMIILYFGLITALVITWIISIIDVVKNDFERDSDKTRWLVILLLIAPLGTILYQLIGKKQKLTNSTSKPKVKNYSESKYNQDKSAIETKTEKCIKCGNVMKERVVLSGEKAGQKFLVCNSYPTCKSIKQLTAE